MNHSTRKSHQALAGTPEDHGSPICQTVIVIGTCGRASHGLALGVPGWRVAEVMPFLAIPTGSFTPTVRRDHLCLIGDHAIGMAATDGARRHSSALPGTLQ